MGFHGMENMGFHDDIYIYIIHYIYIYLIYIYIIYIYIFVTIDLLGGF